MFSLLLGIISSRIEKKKKPKFFSKEDLQLIIDEVQHEQLKYQAIFFLAISGGLRRGEILGLKIEDVKDKGVRIHEAKNISSERFLLLMILLWSS
jgi:integrase